VKGLIVSVTKLHFFLLNTEFLGVNADLQNLPHGAADSNEGRLAERRRKGEAEKHPHKALETSAAAQVRLGEASLPGGCGRSSGSSQGSDAMVTNAPLLERVSRGNPTHPPVAPIPAAR